MLSRRLFLKASGAVAIAACPLCRAAIAADGPHWSYEGAEGPDHWGELSPEFRACGVGAEQSPIDLSDPVPSALGDLSIAWRAVPAKVVNNGHTIQVQVAPGSLVRIGGTSYELTQFHFHRPAEHTVDGTRRAMEAHFVHMAADGNAAAVGVFLVSGALNATLAEVFERMPTAPGEAALAEPFDPTPLLPLSRAYYRYAGSLTTPPCGETVLWTIFAEPVEVSEAQIAAFAALYSMNARPLQKLNRRFLLGSFQGGGG